MRKSHEPSQNPNLKGSPVLVGVPEGQALGFYVL